MGKQRMIRRTDSLGRLVLPVKWRKRESLNEGDAVSFCTEGDFIVIKKDVPSCIFCSKEETLIDFNSRKICKKCFAELKTNAE